MMRANERKPEYNFTFDASDLKEIKKCYHEHGYAVVKSVIDTTLVEDLKRGVLEVADPEQKMKRGEAKTVHGFIEHTPRVLGLLENENFMNINRHIIGHEDLTVHRCAAIVRQPGNPGCNFHTDFSFYRGKKKISNDILNKLNRPNGMWFYLGGSRPEKGGLVVIENSHRWNWDGPQGYRFTPHRKSFSALDGNGEWAKAEDAVPGKVSLETEPGDLIVFAARTYHAAYMNHSNEIRLSCGMGFRPTSTKVEVPWELNDSARRLKRSSPKHLKPFLNEYLGIDTSWRAA